MTESEEQAYVEGNRAAWRELYQLAAKNLGYENVPEAKYIIERERAVAALRSVCRDYGDNDWPDNLSLADVIEKHLARHLWSGDE